ncbi:MAG: hypothetical protein JWP10_1228, partial [Nocardioidaceae bacterium]|nr:hypothetical protein [Nocardioidaceae bacterium]
MTMKQSINRLAIIGAAGALALTAACSGSDSQGADTTKKPLQIFMSAGVTGLLAPSQKAVERGVRAKIETLNAAGGINGRKVELTVRDNQSDPTRGVT